MNVPWRGDPPALDLADDAEYGMVVDSVDSHLDHPERKKKKQAVSHSQRGLELNFCVRSVQRRV